jgi:hypothetical protein
MANLAIQELCDRRHSQVISYEISFAVIFSISMYMLDPDLPQVAEALGCRTLYANLRTEDTCVKRTT